MSVTPNTLSFTQTLGAAVPAAKTVSVATSSSDITFNTSVNMTSRKKLSAKPSATRRTVTDHPARVRC